MSTVGERRITEGGGSCEEEWEEERKSEEKGDDTCYITQSPIISIYAHA